jgi:K+:H+ antiporter
MSSQDFVIFALQITTMLACAIVFGQLMRMLKQPAVLGEMIGGIVLGPTIFGLLAPGIYTWLFNSSQNAATARDALIKLGMLFFLFITGLEVNLSDLRRLGGRALFIGLIGTVLPILVGVGVVYLIPRSFWGPTASSHYFAFALFIGMNLANSANPVIARILMDLGILKSEIGTFIMTATIVDDLVNWTLLAIILSNISPSGLSAGSPMIISVSLVILFFIFILGIGHWIGPRTLHWFRSHLSWPSGFIALTTLVILIASSISEWLGLNAFLGAFLVGIALGGKDEEKNEAHDVIAYFALSFFAPIYFVSMGMMTNYWTNFDWVLVSILLIVACISKIGAVILGGRLAGMPINREVWAIGFGLNARGATGIILAGVGLSYKLIDERIFVAIVIMAMITSLMSGPIMNSLLQGRVKLTIPQSNSIHDL